MTDQPRQFDAIVLGAGGAGLMCAATAGQLGKKVVLIDHADEPGKKILISGGGRCNFTNRETPAHCYLSANPHFCKSALSRYTSQDFITLVDGYNIAWHEKTLGQLFCDGSARQIVEMLMLEAQKGAVELCIGESIGSVSKSDENFVVSTNKGIYSAKSLVIATGGPSIPKLGATGFAYDLARQFGLKIVEPRPALVPLTLATDQALFKELSGVATEVITRCKETSFREAALFTHKGLSGPAILQISSYWRHGQEVCVTFCPDEPVGWLRNAKRSTPNATVARHLTEKLPSRLAEALLQRNSGLADFTKPLGELKDEVLGQLEESLASWAFWPNGTEGFAKAEVTIGGVSTNELSSKTMEAKKMPGLFIIGEAVDVTGWLGGYNFQWAWASGVAAGQAM